MEKIVMFSAVVLLLLFGCSSQSSPPAQNLPAPQPQAAPPAAPSNNQPAAPTVSASDSLKELLVLQENVKYRINYTIDVILANVSFEEYAKGRDRRTDSNVTGEFRTYKLNGVYYGCTLNDSEWSCKKAVNPVSFFPAVNKNSLSNFTVTGMPGRQIAGVSAKCFNLVGSWATMDYCLSAEGAPLYISANSGGVNGKPVPIVQVATSYTTQVSDPDFELPAKVE